MYFCPIRREGYEGTRAVVDSVLCHTLTLGEYILEDRVTSQDPWNHIRGKMFFSEVSYKTMWNYMDFTRCYVAEFFWDVLLLRFREFWFLWLNVHRSWGYKLRNHQVQNQWISNVFISVIAVMLLVIIVLVKLKSQNILL